MKVEQDQCSNKYIGMQIIIIIVSIISILVYRVDSKNFSESSKTPFFIPKTVHGKRIGLQPVLLQNIK